MKLYVKINSANDAVTFINRLSKYGCEADMIYGRNHIDAKSLLGVIGVATGKKVILNVYSEEEEIREELQEYIA